MIVVGNIYAGLNQSGGGGTVTTANFISGDGSVGNPIILNGAGNQATKLNLNGFPLLIDDVTDTANQINVLFTGGGWQLHLLDDGVRTVDIFANTFAINISASDLITSQNTNLLIENTQTNLSAQDTIGNSKQVLLESSASTNGILIKDQIEQIGLKGDQYFTKSDPNQYIQLQDLTNNQNTPNVLNQSVVGSNSGTSQVFGTLTPTTFYRLNMYALYKFGGIIVDLQLVFTDNNGVVQTVAIGSTINNLNTFSGGTYVFNAQGFTFNHINVIVTGTPGGCDYCFTLERLI